MGNDAQLKLLAAQMREQLELSDHADRHAKHLEVFFGNQAVQWLQATGVASTQDAALKVGNDMLQLGLFHHTKGGHEFSNTSDDSYYFDGLWCFLVALSFANSAAAPSIRGLLHKNFRDTNFGPAGELVKGQRLLRPEVFESASGFTTEHLVEGWCALDVRAARIEAALTGSALVDHLQRWIIGYSHLKHAMTFPSREPAFGRHRFLTVYLFVLRSVLLFALLLTAAQCVAAAIATLSNGCSVLSDPVLPWWENDDGGTELSSNGYADTGSGDNPEETWASTFALDSAASVASGGCMYLLRLAGIVLLGAICLSILAGLFCFVATGAGDASAVDATALERVWSYIRSQDLNAAADAATAVARRPVGELTDSATSLGELSTGMYVAETCHDHRTKRQLQSKWGGHHDTTPAIYYELPGYRVAEPPMRRLHSRAQSRAASVGQRSVGLSKVESGVAMNSSDSSDPSQVPHTPAQSPSPGTASPVLSARRPASLLSAVPWFFADKGGGGGGGGISRADTVASVESGRSGAGGGASPAPGDAANGSTSPPVPTLRRKGSIWGRSNKPAGTPYRIRKDEWRAILARSATLHRAEFRPRLEPDVS